METLEHLHANLVILIRLVGRTLPSLINDWLLKWPKLVQITLRQHTNIRPIIIIVSILGSQCHLHYPPAHRQLESKCQHATRNTHVCMSALALSNSHFFPGKYQIYQSLHQWSGRFLGTIIGWDPSVCNSNRLHVHILRWTVFLY